MCVWECYCCGPSWDSWAGVANAIAIIDLAISMITVTFETATLGSLMGILVPLNQDRSNCSETYNTNSGSIGGIDNCTAWLYEYVGDDIHFDFDTYAVTALLVFILLGFIVEGYLFSTLREGAREKIYRHCRKWFNYRLFLLALVTLGSIGKFWTNQYYLPIDGFLDFLKIYRIITLIIVKCFMTELAHTVGMIYIKPPKKAKRGSL